MRQAGESCGSARSVRYCLEIRLCRCKLFAHVNPAVLQRSTYAALVALLDNYHPGIGIVEHFNSSQQAEIDSYLNALTNTPVMRRTYEFLKNRGYVGQSMPDFREKMKSLWFTLYPRSSRSSHHQQDSSGFEHTFSGETYSNKVTGFHNWVRFYLEEKSGHINYLGYIQQEQPNILATRFTWNGVKKQLGSMWVGTSPEFEMAAYTSCFLIHKGHLCQFHINGYAVSIQTYEFAGIPGDQIASAFVRL